MSNFWGKGATVITPAKEDSFWGKGATPVMSERKNKLRDITQEDLRETAELSPQEMVSPPTHKGLMGAGALWKPKKGTKRSEITQEEAKAELSERNKRNREADRLLARVGRDVAAGAGDVLDLPALPFEALRYGAHKAAHAIAPEHVGNTQFGEWIPGVGQKISEQIDESTGGFTSDRTSGERLASSARRALASLPVTGGAGAALQVAGKAPKTAAFIREASKINPLNVGSTLGGTGATHAYLESSKDPGALGLIGSGTAGGVLGGVLGGMAAPWAIRGGMAAGRALRNPKDAAAEAIGRMSGFEPERFEAAKKIGAHPTLATATAKDYPTQLELIWSKLPGSGPVLKKVLNQREAALAKNLGVEGDLFDVVKDPQMYLARKSGKELQALESRKYAKATEAVTTQLKKAKDEKKLIDVSDILENIKKEYGRGLNTPAEKKLFKRNYAGKVYQDLEDIIHRHGGEGLSPKEITKLKKQGYSQDFIDKIAGEQKAGHQVSYGAFDTIKDEILHRMTDHNLSPKARRQASDLYGMFLKKDYDFVENLVGSKNAKEWVMANEDYADFASKRRSNLQKAAHKLRDSTSDKEAFDLMLTDPRYLEVAKKGLDSSEKEKMVTSLMSQMGLNQGKFNIAAAHSKWTNKNMDPNTRKAFLELLPTKESRTAFENTMDFIGRNKEKITKLANASGTSHTATTTNLAIGTAEDLAEAIVKVSAKKALTTVLGLVSRIKGSKTAANLWTDPIFLERVNKVIKARNAKAEKNYLNLLLKTPSLKKVLNRSRLESARAATETE